jgi:hypothetical protein
MIELNSKTQQDFLNREWVQRLLDAGVDMSDAKYCIVEYHNYDVVFYKNSIFTTNEPVTNIIPTYTVSELLYKLHEWIYPTIDGEEYSGGLRVAKDAPFYFAFYDLKNKEGKKKTEKFFAEFEYPIESLASLLIQCHKKDIGIDRKDTGNISDK